MSDLVFHMVLFIIAGTVLVMAPLLIGRLVRPNLPTAEKDAVYECGEPTIGSSFIQWDLRFYTIALLFIVFDVEVAFFFPWATLYGGTMQLADTQLDTAARYDLTDKLLNQVPGTSEATGEVIASGEAVQLGLLAFSDIMVFFGVLLVGFAYVWKRGDLEWVRAAINSSSQRALPDQ
jgi:NADH-quinone oxidoreductase subunit A